MGRIVLSDVPPTAAGYSSPTNSGYLRIPRAHEPDDNSHILTLFGNSLPLIVNVPIGPLQGGTGLNKADSLRE